MASITTVPVTPPEPSGQVSPSRLKLSRSFTNLFKSLRIGTRPDELQPLQAGTEASSATSGPGALLTPKHSHSPGISSPFIDINHVHSPLTPSTSGGAEGTLSPTDEKDEKLFLHHAAAFINGNEKTFGELPKLSKPVIIPRLGTDITSPIIRAWPKELEQHAITVEDFLTFVDNINILGNPPAAAMFLQVAAIGIEFIPFDGADGLAVLTELAAIGISYKIIIERCNKLIKKVNDDYFHPRALHVRLVNTKKMTRSLGIPSDEPLIAPLEESILSMTAHERCMEQLKQYCSELSYEVPAPSPQTKLLAKFAAWNVEKKRKKFEKCSKRARKRAWKKHQAGKKLKREGNQEKSRVKKLQWLLIQNLDDFEREERENAEAEEQKKKEKEEKRKTRRISSWGFSQINTFPVIQEPVAQADKSKEAIAKDHSAGLDAERSEKRTGL